MLVSDFALGQAFMHNTYTMFHYGKFMPMEGVTDDPYIQLLPVSPGSDSVGLGSDGRHQLTDSAQAEQEFQGAAGERMVEAGLAM